MPKMTEVNEPRRRFLIGATSFVAGAGVVGAAIPFVQSWNPSAKAKAAGAPVKVNIGKLEPGAMVTVEWQGKPVWVIRRTIENVKNLAMEEHRDELRDPDSEVNQQPEYAKNEYRSIKEEYFVAVGICTHLGCVPNYEPDGRAELRHALFFCPCHGSKFDLAGRVFKGVPAPTNLIIPPHQYLENNVLEIGSDATTR
ncbi:MAG: ubiquinol-cytochrome c reductase iron-sulfur subunit [Porticoccus sp.]|nr:ubiquinol-cytochrome c reductase iron-sulfur subunit [Porticoccus sp.]|tara:strand:- start:2207 stop:2797 length:591 start_codon:yes stop_codon:yes gene_type:complete